MFRATVVRLNKVYHPGCLAEEAKALSRLVVRALREHKELTSEEIWQQVKLRRSNTPNRRPFKRLLRWMKQEKLVHTVLPFDGATNRVFKLVSEEVESQQEAMEAAVERIETLPEVTNNNEVKPISLKFAPRPNIPRDKLRRKANEELRGRAPLMPFWDI